MQLVMGDESEWEEPGAESDQPSREQTVAAALAAIGDHAHREGRTKVAQIAADLLGSVGQGHSREDGASLLEERMSDGIARLQQALAAAEQGGQASDPAAAQPESPAPESSTKAPRPLALNQDPELLADFVLESREHLETIERELLTLEHDPANHEALHAVFRGFHTIKGLAGFLEMHAVQEVAHETETALDLARNGKLAISAAVIDVVLASADYLKGALAGVEASIKTRTAPEAADNRALKERIRGFTEAPTETAAPPAEAAPVKAALVKAAPMEAPAMAPPAPASPVAGSGAPAAPQPAPKGVVPGAGSLQASAVKVDTAKLDHLVDMVGEMVIAQSLMHHDPDLAASPRLQRKLQQLKRVTTDVQRTAMAMRMVPVAQLFQRMARLVRDLSRKTGKKVELAISGEDTELDRNIVEVLADPLMHMVRNALDHGLEPPEERSAAGKPETGNLALRAYHQSGQIVIEIGDDGRGLSRERILRKAREKGLAASEEALSDNDVFNLIFEPGFSTAERITDVSGRGVGMDVVKRNIARLRGRIDIRSVAGQGATFLLKLPLTLAIIDGLVVQVGGERYVVPIATVREMLRPVAGDVFTVQGRGEMVMVRGGLLPLIRLHRRFGVAPRTEDPAAGVLLVTETVARRFCLLVDDLLGKQEVVIKSLGEGLKNVPGVAGGAILGDGRVGLILDLEGIAGAASDG